MRLVSYALRPYALAALLAVASSVVTVAVAHSYDLPLRDPDGIAGPAYLRLPGAVLLLVLIDVVPRVIKRRGELRQILRERYGPERIALLAVGLAVFYTCYVAYRNLKGALPFARPERLDNQLLNLDRLMGFGQDPALLLHDLLGTGTAAHVLSAVYLSFLVFVPLSLGVALVWARSVWTSAWYVTALCLNWLLGAASYYLVPSLGPVFVRPHLFDQLPATGVTSLQISLETARLAVLADPAGADAIAGVAGFASLHVSIVFTAALIAHRLGLHRALRWGLWAFLAGTITATAYFGWHYLIDDVAGLILGGTAVSMAEWATRRARLEPLPEPVQEPVRELATGSSVRTG